MFDEYDEPPQDCCYADLDEYLAEYVDGTMDRATAASFEELLSQQPDVAMHACCLQRLRSELCQLQQLRHAPPGFELRLREEIARDGGLFTRGQPLLSGDHPTLRFTGLLACFLVIMMAMGADISNETINPSEEISSLFQQADSGKREAPRLSDGYFSQPTSTQSPQRFMLASTVMTASMVTPMLALGDSLKPFRTSTTAIPAP